MINEDAIQSRNIRIAVGANPWARISEVAAKVGVRPCSEGPPSQPTLRATGGDGKQYDVWEVIIAVLDRLAEAK